MAAFDRRDVLVSRSTGLLFFRRRRQHCCLRTVLLGDSEKSVEEDCENMLGRQKHLASDKDPRLTVANKE